MGWVDLLNKPEWAITMPEESQEILDTLQHLLPIPNGIDRYVVMSTWLKTAVDNGILTIREVARLKNHIAQVM